MTETAAPGGDGELVAALSAHGLYDPAAPDAEQRLALLRHYTERGITVEQMASAEKEGRLPVLSGDLTFFDLGPQLTLDEVALACGVSVDRVRRTRVATGLPTEREDEVPAWVVEDISGFLVAAELFGEPATLAFSRLLGSTASRLAEAAVSLFLTEVDRGLAERQAPPVEWALANEQAGYLVGVASTISSHLLREHLSRAIRRQRALVSPGGGAVVSTTIGFVDLVRSTEWASTLTPLAQADALAVFESAAWDLTTRHNGRVVKLIGDEVMFVADDAADACRIGLELCAAIAEEETLPAARAALGYGEVAFRDGDFFGPLVHVTARAVKAAEPATVVATDGVRESCEHEATGLSFEPLGARELRGVPDPVELYLVSASGRSRAPS